MENIIEANSVSKIYRMDGTSVQAVNDVTFSVRAGEFVGLVGPSGSGKTTLLAMLAALLDPSGGQICINDHDLKQIHEKDRVLFRRKEIGFTFQANNLIPYLTVLENVEFMLRLNKQYTKENHERARELLVRLGMEDRINVLPRQLSGGERQRVSIARSVVHNPSVVLADEPTASLDSERAYQVVKIFADLIHEQNKAGIMVTHDLRMCKYVDKIFQMKDGQIVSAISDRQAIESLMACA
ncbi:MAG TPA: ABC transporter ATP-binding protein [Anaerolineaceae bacterium]|nr:ABC transporter ATP-binding protein [Anaerolineaceae bacterium]